MIQGIDVSHWEGEIDWDAVKLSGIDFAYLKATQGTWMVDDWLHTNVKGCKDAGVHYALYHFLDPFSDPGKEQYDFFMEKTQGLHSALPNALDVEWKGDLSNSKLTTWVLDFLDNMDDWLLYSNLNYLDNILQKPDEIAEHADLWLAWPSTASQPRMPKKYDADKVKVWQWSWTEHIPGIVGDTDANMIIDEAWYRSHVGGNGESWAKITVPHGVEVTVEHV